MGNELICQCFICKKGILKENELDPCAVTKAQTLFCHYECFRNINNDDGTLCLSDLSTPRECNEEMELLSNKIKRFGELLELKAMKSGIWGNLFAQPKGLWQPLRPLINDDVDLHIELTAIEELLVDRLLIMWADDFESENRITKKLWRVVIIATEGHYRFPTTLLIGL